MIRDRCRLTELSGVVVDLAGVGESRCPKVAKLERERISGDRSTNACGRDTLRVSGVGDS
jgi:hypothetical protein